MKILHIKRALAIGLVSGFVAGFIMFFLQAITGIILLHPAGGFIGLIYLFIPAIISGYYSNSIDFEQSTKRRDLQNALLMGVISLLIGATFIFLPISAITGIFFIHPAGGFIGIFSFCFPAILAGYFSRCLEPIKNAERIEGEKKLIKYEQKKKLNELLTKRKPFMYRFGKGIRKLF